MLINGQKINHLTVIQTGIRNPKDNRLMVKCRCDCGNEKIIRQSDLLSGHTKTCGCKREKTKNKKKQKIKIILPVGQRFGKLVVINNTDIVYNKKKHMIKCRCDCGNEIYVNKYFLIHKYKTQCDQCKENQLLKVGCRKGHLVLTKEIDNNHFEVHCDCGNTKIMTKPSIYHKGYCGENGCATKKKSQLK